MTKFIFNPFRYIAGFKSLIAGFCILIFTAIVGYFSHTHFPDLISIKSGADFPISYFVLQGFSNWLVISIVLFTISIFASSSNVRFVDVFGTQALARFPYFIASFIGFSGSMEKFGKWVLWSLSKTGDETVISSGEIVIALLLIIFSLLLTIWLVVLIYNAFKVSVNIKGVKSIILFIAAFIVSMTITIFISKYLIQQFS